jgi:hypothetical protein
MKKYIDELASEAGFSRIYESERPEFVMISK